MRKRSWSLIVLFACITILFSPVACTYDYFVDETNYLLLVPEVRDRTVQDCRVMIYNESGTLIAEKYATAPWENDRRVYQGEFAFRLPPGEYNVYCYTNTDSVSFVDTRAYDTSAFHLLKNGSEHNFHQPSDLHYQKLVRNVVHPGILNRDTANLERYVGRITVRFKNFPIDVSRINKVQLVAEGIATKQLLNKDTLTTRMSENDIMMRMDGLEMMQLTTTSVEVDHRYFPSIEDGYKILKFTFLDSQNETVVHLPVEVAELDTYKPLRLLHGRRIIIEVDSYIISKISIVGWNEDISSGDVDLE